jgi:hypothetical protein
VKNKIQNSILIVVLVMAGLIFFGPLLMHWWHRGNPKMLYQAVRMRGNMELKGYNLSIYSRDGDYYCDSYRWYNNQTDRNEYLDAFKKKTSKPGPSYFVIVVRDDYQTYLRRDLHSLKNYRNMKELMADKEPFTEPIVTDDHGRVKN